MSQTKQTTLAPPLAMVQMPMQEWKDVYEPGKALKAGTIFAELDKPFFGGENNGKK